MKLLHLDSSILGDSSVSRLLSSAIVERIRHGAPDVDVTYRDLVAEPIPHLTGGYLAGVHADTQHDEALQADLALGRRALEEFLAADTVVIGVALYNFTVASQLKTWIDRILVVGKTFQYGPNGAEGLADGKRVYLAVARGGFYGAGLPHQSMEHAETYLRSMLGFIGIVDPAVIVAEGIAIGPEQRQVAVAKALAEIERLEAA